MKISKNNCDLKSCFLCQLCMKEWLPAIDAHRKNIEFKKGELIFKEGDPVEGIYFLFRGMAKVHKRWDNQKELILRFAKKGNIVGHRGLGSDNVYPVSATALEPVTVCFIDLRFFESTLRVNYDFIFQLMMFYAKELQESERKMRNMAHMSVKGRIAQSLLLFKEKFGVTERGLIDLEVSRQDLASYVGSTYETVFRVMNELVEHAVITVSGRSIAIINQQLLADFIKEENL